MAQPPIHSTNLAFRDLWGSKSRNQDHFRVQWIKFDRKMPKYGNRFFGKCYAFFAGVPNLLYTPPTLGWPLFWGEKESNNERGLPLNIKGKTFIRIPCLKRETEWGRVERRSLCLYYWKGDQSSLGWSACGRWCLLSYTDWNIICRIPLLRARITGRLKINYNKIS